MILRKTEKLCSLSINKTIDDEEWTRRWANGEFSRSANIESALHQLAVDTLKIAVLDKDPIGRRFSVY